MSEEMIIRHCAPTLAGLKTGNLFSVAFTSEDELQSDIDELNAVLDEKGMRIVVLRIRDGRALIYVYRPGKLCRDLDRTESKEILSRFGYSDCIESETCLSRLVQRLGTSTDFPHEIGLFLGYPPEDVRGFIDCRGRGYKTCGYWKVYGDETKASKLFDQYTKCTCVYLDCHSRGFTFDRLAVGSRKTA